MSHALFHMTAQNLGSKIARFSLIISLYRPSSFYKKKIYMKGGGYTTLFFIPEKVKKANSLCAIYAVSHTYNCVRIIIMSHKLLIFIVRGPKSLFSTIKIERNHWYCAQGYVRSIRSVDKP